MGPRIDEIQRWKPLKSKPGSAQPAVPGSRPVVSPRPGQTFIHSGFVDQLHSRPKLSPSGGDPFQPVLVMQSTQDRFADDLETFGQGMTIGIGLDRHSGGRRPAGYTWRVETAGVNYALHVEGLKDPSGNLLQPEDRVLVVADGEVFEVLVDTAPPVLLAVMDASDGVYLVFDEAVQSEGMADAIELRRQGALLEGETSRVSGSVLKWHSTSTDLGGNFHLGGQYALSVVGVEDLAGEAADVAAMSFTHLAVEGQVLIARQAATESVPVAGSAYGLTTLFQGRTWHSDLGMYYYRARWYLPEGGVFGERDPVAGAGTRPTKILSRGSLYREFDLLDFIPETAYSNLYHVLNLNGENYIDPFGLLEVHAYYDKSEKWGDSKEHPYVYEIYFDSKIERANGAAKKLKDNVIKSWKWVFRVGGEVDKAFRGAPYRVFGRDTGVSAVSGWVDGPAFEEKIKERFHYYLRKKTFYDDRAIKAMQLAIDDVLSELVGNGDISVGEAKRIREIYDAEKIFGEARKLASKKPHR